MTAFPPSQTAVGRYSALALPIAFAGFPLYVLAQDYYATVQALPLGLLGALLLGIRFFDAVLDPLIGAISDRLRPVTHWLMVSASFLLCAAMIGLFSAAPLNPALWFVLCMALAVLSYSVLSINLNTLGGLWCEDPVAQLRITSMREACGLVGLVVAVSLPTLFRQFVDDAQAYTYYCVVLCCLMGGAWIVFWPWLQTHSRHRLSHHIQSTSLRVSLASISPVTWRFFCVYGMNMLASAIPAILVIFFVRDLLGAEKWTGVFLLFYFLSGALAMPFWKSVSVRHGPYRTWLYSMLLAVANFVGAFFLQAGDVWLYGLVCILSGLALGADIALPPAILADQIHLSRTQDHAAVQYSLLALFSKLGIAMASAVVLPLLGLAGFVPMSANAPSALLLLSTAYALLPCLMKLGAAALLARFFIYSEQGDCNENLENHRYHGSSGHV